MFLWFASWEQSPKRLYKSQKVSFAGSRRSRDFHGNRSERGVLSIALNLSDLEPFLQHMFLRHWNLHKLTKSSRWKLNNAASTSRGALKNHRLTCQSLPFLSFHLDKHFKADQTSGRISCDSCLRMWEAYHNTWYTVGISVKQRELSFAAMESLRFTCWSTVDQPLIRFWLEVAWSVPLSAQFLGVLDHKEGHRQCSKSLQQSATRSLLNWNHKPRWLRSQTCWHWS